MADLTYEDGYRHGESSRDADWALGLDHLPDDIEPTPQAVDRYIVGLQQRLGAIAP